MEDPTTELENLVSTGPYAGTLEAFATGVKLRGRYKDLLDEAQTRGRMTYWASDSERVIDTAKYFGAGFFGIDDAQVTLEVIPETPDRGADTLTPGRTCLKYRNDIDDFGHAYGYRMMDAFRETYEPAISDRLAKENPDFPLTDDEVFTMQVMCGFEIIAKGSSPWCDVFTEEDWENFEYARDVIHYYRSGPGNPYGATMGWLWLNATAQLLAQGPETAGPLFFSLYVPPPLLSFGTQHPPKPHPPKLTPPSVHDGDLIPLITVLELLPQTPHLPTTHRLSPRAFRTSSVVPMGGRLILERLACPAPTDCWSNAPFYPNHLYCAPPEEQTFVRANVNDGIVALPGCDGGPGRSCPLEAFLARVSGMKEGREGEFARVCGLSEGAAERITFLHQ